ncbi:MAG TPA: YceD family protein [Nevskiaceae bacterium]|nr:YceD family protein [Nevskiaceae bacterium]
MDASLRQLPLRVSAADGLASSWTFDGVVRLAKLPRILSACVAPDVATTLSVSLQLQRTPLRDELLTGRVIGALPLRCQRCLGICTWSFDLELSLQLVYSEAQARSRQAVAEVYEVPEDGFLPLCEIVGEEVLLALPIAPRHPDGACRAPGGAAVGDAQALIT